MPVINTREKDLRSKKVYVEFPFVGTKHRNSFFPYMTRLWNRLPKDVKSKSVDEFKLYIQKEVKPKRYKFYAKGQKYKCSLLTRIRVGRTILKEHSFLIGLSDTMSCPKCDNNQESPIHFITTCPFFTEQREIMITKMLQFIPDFKNLPKKRQYEILVHGYDRENDELTYINKNIMFFTQDFIYNSKRFIIPNHNLGDG